MPLLEKDFGVGRGLLSKNETLRAYNPSWGDKIASWLMGDSQASPERRQFVGGLLGTTGLGRTNIGALDATPVGAVLDLQRASQEGDRTGMALAAAGILPGAGVAEKVAAKVADAAAPAVKEGIIAYHGSPHSFDKFDLSKIGTGEGAQAYGHGLYFAESEPVAKSYRDALKPGYFNNVLTIDGRDFGSDMGNYYLRNAVEKAVPSPGAGFASGKETFDFYNKEMSDAVYKALLKAETGHDVNSVAASTVDAVLKKNAPYEDEAAAVDEIRRALLGHIQNNVTSRPNGSMYQVRINADPNAFLDWDRPFANADEVERFAAKFDNFDPGIRKKIEDWGYTRQQSGQPMPDGNDIMREVFGGVEGQKGREATRAFREAGIPGIKYLDAGSRGSGEGSRNYVVFDDSLIEILRKYGLLGAIGVPSAYSTMQQFQPAPNQAPVT